MIYISSFIVQCWWSSWLFAYKETKYCYQRGIILYIRYGVVAKFFRMWTIIIIARCGDVEEKRQQPINWECRMRGAKCTKRATASCCWCSRTCIHTYTVCRVWCMHRDGLLPWRDRERESFDVDRRSELEKDINFIHYPGVTLAAATGHAERYSREGFLKIPKNQKGHRGEQ